MTYKWDVFISYRRANPVERWVQRILKPAIQDWLPGHGGVTSPRIFLDVEPRSGASTSAWPSHLREALATSKVIVPVLSPEYFTSPWCLAELATMLWRENETGRRVVHPVQFSDGIFYPPEHKSLDWREFERYSKYRRPSEVPKGFYDRVETLCKELGDCCRRAPTFDPSWAAHVELPTVAESPPRAPPRFVDE